MASADFAQASTLTIVFLHNSHHDIVGQEHVDDDNKKNGCDVQFSGGVTILAAGRLLRFGCATGYPPFTNQVLAQLDHHRNSMHTNCVHFPPSTLGEKGAAFHLPPFGAKVNSAMSTSHCSLWRCFGTITQDFVIGKAKVAEDVIIAIGFVDWRDMNKPGVHLTGRWAIGVGLHLSSIYEFVTMCLRSLPPFRFHAIFAFGFAPGRCVGCIGNLWGNAHLGLPSYGSRKILPRIGQRTV